MQVHNLEKKILAKILAKLPPSPNKKILINVKMFFRIPKKSILIPIYSVTVYLQTWSLNVKNTKLKSEKKNKYKINLL